MPKATLAPTPRGLSLTQESAHHHSNPPSAYELYLRAVSEGNSTNAQIENTIRLLQRAVAVDPSYSSAWARLGHFYYYKSGFGDVDKASRLRAKAALQRARWRSIPGALTRPATSSLWKARKAS